RSDRDWSSDVCSSDLADGRTERHHLDFVDLVDRSVWVYGQTEVTKDLMQARERAGQAAFYGVSDVALHDLEGDRPSVTFVDAEEIGRASCRERVESMV